MGQFGAPPKTLLKVFLLQLPLGILKTGYIYLQLVSLNFGGKQKFFESFFDPATIGDFEKA